MFGSAVQRSAEAEVAEMWHGAVYHPGLSGPGRQNLKAIRAVAEAAYMLGGCIYEHAYKDYRR